MNYQTWVQIIGVQAKRGAARSSGLETGTPPYKGVSRPKMLMKNENNVELNNLNRNIGNFQSLVNRIDVPGK